MCCVFESLLVSSLFCCGLGTGLKTRNGFGNGLKSGFGIDLKTVPESVVVSESGLESIAVLDCLEIGHGFGSFRTGFWIGLDRCRNQLKGGGGGGGRGCLAVSVTSIMAIGDRV